MTPTHSVEALKGPNHSGIQAESIFNPAPSQSPPRYTLSDTRFRPRPASDIIGLDERHKHVLRLIDQSAQVLDKIENLPKGGRPPIRALLERAFHLHIKEDLRTLHLWFYEGKQIESSDLTMLVTNANKRLGRLDSAVSECQLAFDDYQNRLLNIDDSRKGIETIWAKFLKEEPRFFDPLHLRWEKLSPVLHELIQTDTFGRLFGVYQQQALFHAPLSHTNNHTRGEHSIGTAMLVAKLLDRAKSLNLTDKEVEELVICGLLHDLRHLPYSHALEGLLPESDHHSEAGLPLRNRYVGVLSHDHDEALIRFLNQEDNDVVRVLKARNHDPKRIAKLLQSGAASLIVCGMGDRLDYAARDLRKSEVTRTVNHLVDKLGESLTSVRSGKEVQYAFNSQAWPYLETLTELRALSFELSSGLIEARLAQEVINQAIGDYLISQRPDDEYSTPNGYSAESPEVDQRILETMTDKDLILELDTNDPYYGSFIRHIQALAEGVRTERGISSFFSSALQFSADDFTSEGADLLRRKKLISALRSRLGRDLDQHPILIQPRHPGGTRYPILSPEGELSTVRFSPHKQREEILAICTSYSANMPPEEVKAWVLTLLGSYLSRDGRTKLNKMIEDLEYPLSSSRFATS